MSEAIEIGLHKAGAAPGKADLARWVVGGNMFVFTILTMMFVIVPWSSGAQMRVDFGSLALAGVAAIVLMAGFLVVMARRHAASAKPAARLKMDANRVAIVGSEGADISCDRADWRAEPVHAYEQLRGAEYYMGPALAVRLGEADEIIIATIDAGHRWQHDPRGVARIDWLCTAPDWLELLGQEELTDALVAYGEDA